MAVKTINSVRNALSVLEALAPAQPIGVSALSRQVDLDKAAVQRILLTLGEAGWVHRSDTGEWALTSRALQVGARFTSGLHESAHSYLVDLQHRTGETAMLFAREHATIVLVDAVDSTQALRMTVPIGTAVPISRVGAFDAFLTDAERADLPPGDGSSPSAAAIAAARKRGWFVVEHLYPNSVAAGAPIIDGAGRAIAALVVVGPKARIAPTVARTIGRLTAEAARSLSTAIGGTQP